MKKKFLFISIILAFGLPGLIFPQSRRAKKEAAAKEAAAQQAAKDSAAKVAAIKTDTTIKAPADTSKPVAAIAVADTIVKKDTVVVAAAATKDCFQEWYEKFRAKGATKVTDGVQPVIITLKSESGSVCLIGKVEVVGGKMKLPLLVQQEDGEYKPFNATGRKLDPAFASTMSEDQLLAITDGMSVTFRTSNHEYGRLIFYTFVNKSAKVNKPAPSPDELLNAQ
jgi:hypothetical protein